MIESFDYFFGGHVEMTDMGFAGRRVDDRIESDGHLATVFDEALSMAQLMEPLNYDTLWLAEHHFQREGYGGIGNIPLLSVWLAGKTERLKFGAMFNTVPAWHPLRLAEDFAAADILTEGRVRFGIGRGYINREVETLGSPLDDDEANRERFEEQVDVIFKAWNEQSFSHRGRHFDIPPKVIYREQELEELTLVPRPRTLPVECWQPIFSVSPARHRLHDETRDQGGRPGRRARRRDRPQVAGGARRARPRHRVGRGPGAGAAGDARRHRGGGDSRGRGLVRGAAQGAVAPRQDAVPQAGADPGDLRSAEGPECGPADGARPAARRRLGLRSA